MTEHDPPEVDEEYCDCPGPPSPPQFMVPPPPPPPALQSCRAGETATHHYCHLEPVGAEYTQAAFPSLPIIAVCSSVVLVAVLVASFLIWKHKKKVQHFLPCKDDHQGRCDLSTSNGLTYDDVLLNHHPTRIPQHNSANPHTLTPIELLDVKYSAFVPGTFSHSNCTFGSKEVCNGRSSNNRDHFNPIYEEVSGGSEDKSRSYYSDIDDSEVDRRTVASEDEFAEDELSVAEAPTDLNQLRSDSSSLRGSTGGDLCDSSDSEKRCLDHDSRTQGAAGPKTHCIKSRSLERNKDGHASEAKQNYYMKKVLSPDFSYQDLQDTCPNTILPRSTSGSQRDSGLPHSGNSMELDVGHTSSAPNHSSTPSDPSPFGGTADIQHPLTGFFRLTTESPPPPPYTPVIGGQRDSYAPHSCNTPRLPDALLQELGQKLGSPYLPPVCKTHTYHPAGRIPTPPPHSFYPCVEEQGLFTIDGTRHRMMSANRPRQMEQKQCRVGPFAHRMLSNKDRTRTHASDECDVRTSSST